MTRARVARPLGQFLERIRPGLGEPKRRRVWVSAGVGNVAIAHGELAEAYAGYADDDHHNRAMASGYEAYALAGGQNRLGEIGSGDGNAATARGNGARALAYFGDDNTATATGDGARAYTHTGNGNTATATGAGSQAQAHTGDDNTAVATDGNFACAGWGDNGETAVNENLCR